MPRAKWNASSAAAEIETCAPHSICSLNSLPLQPRREIYSRLISSELIERYHLNLSPDNSEFDQFLKIHGEVGSPSVEISLFHQPGFPDPLQCTQITDTLNGTLSILYFSSSDPNSPRFDIDRMANGELTEMGTRLRNLEAETAAFTAGLAPGQIRRGLRMLGPAVESFEDFVRWLGHELFFVQPLFYHTAVMFEQRGFAYAKGRQLMERIDLGFQAGGEFARQLDRSTTFRSPDAADSIRLRSWALHDGLLEEPFFNVTMYKMVGKSAEINTCPGCAW